MKYQSPGTLRKLIALAEQRADGLAGRCQDLERTNIALTRQLAASQEVRAAQLVQIRKMETGIVIGPDMVWKSSDTLRMEALLLMRLGGIVRFTPPELVAVEDGYVGTTTDSLTGDTILRFTPKRTTAAGPTCSPVSDRG